MMRLILLPLVFLLLLPRLGWGQAIPPITEMVFAIPVRTASLQSVSDDSSCIAARRLAEADIANCTPHLVLLGGFLPIIYDQTDSLFQQAFEVSYWGMGCINPGRACLAVYNERIFRYLTQTRGQAWMQTIRREVVGYEQWARKK